MQEFQQRVMDEKKDLDGNRERLLAFFNTDVFRGLNQAEKDRLRTQHGVMGVYSDILGQRITAFASEVAPDASTWMPTPVDESFRK